MKSQYLIGFAVFIAFVGLIEFYFGWLNLLAPWRALPYSLLLLAIILTFASYWVRAMRLYDYFRDDMQGAFAACFKLMLLHNFFNNLLPMRAGEVSFPLLMKRYFDVPLMRSAPALLWFRVLDMHTLVLLALAITVRPWSYAAIACLLWLSVPYLLFLGNAKTLKLLDANPGGRPRRLLHKVLISLPHTHSAFGRAWLWTVINWIVKLGVFVWVLRLFIEIPFRAAWLGVIGGDVTSVLPIHSFAGAGTYEAGVVAALLPFGAPTEATFKAAINLHLFLLASTLLGGALSLLLPSPAVKNSQPT
ncbi:MAG: lysylphosphatidylglycerol synthase transmembrane domain-containing protein [Gammaproteobacteria bacterium]